MNLKLANNAVAQIAAPITASQTSFSLLAGQGAKFPVLNSGDYFTLTVTQPNGVREVMWVTARAFDVLTVIRGKENTIALDFDTLTIVENRLTAESLLTEIHAMNSLVNVALSTFQPGVPVGSDQLRLLLVGVLGIDQLNADLASRIAQIDATSAVQGSVNQRVKAATDAFVAALLQEANTRTTQIANYGYSKQDTISAISAQVQVTSAQLTAYADAARQQAISQSTAFVQGYTFSQADIRGAISASEQTLRAEFTGGPGGGPSYATQAYVQTYAYSMAQADGAIANQTADLRSTVGNNTAAIQTSMTTLNGLSAQVYTKIDNNGYVTGYGLSSSTATSTPTSAFIVRAEQFMFVAANGVPQPLFSISNVGGKATAVLRGTLSIGGSPDNIIPDPAFHDLAWWGRLGSPVYDYSGGGSYSNNGYALVVNQANGAFQDTYTDLFPMTPGATYLVEFQVYMDNEYVGNAGVYWLIPNVTWHSMGAPTIGSYSDGLPIQFDTNSPKGPRNFSATYTVPQNGYTSQSRIRIKSQCQAGLIEFSSISITRMSDSTLITEKGVKAKNIDVINLSAINSILGTVDVGVNGYVRSGQTAFNTGSGFWIGNDGGTSKLSIGNPNGNRLTYDGVNLAVVINPGASVNVSPNGQTFNFQSNTQYNGAFIGTYSATPVNTTGTRFSYSWSISSTSSSLAVSTYTNPSLQQVSCQATFKILNQAYDCYLVCVMTDLDSGSSFKGQAVITVNAGG